MGRAPYVHMLWYAVSLLPVSFNRSVFTLFWAGP